MLPVLFYYQVSASPVLLFVVLSLKTLPASLLSSAIMTMHRSIRQASLLPYTVTMEVYSAWSRGRQHHFPAKCHRSRRVNDSPTTDEQLPAVPVEPSLHYFDAYNIKLNTATMTCFPNLKIYFSIFPIDILLSQIDVLEHSHSLLAVLQNIPTTYWRISRTTSEYQAILLQAKGLKAKMFSYNTHYVIPLSYPLVYISSDVTKLPIVIDMGA
eukprot:jgi/Psemu1/61612/gm1.61612_g